MATIVNTKLGEHRGKPRVWLEGQKLAREGYAPGTKLQVEFKNDSVVLTPGIVGRYSVSSRQRNGRINPIVDLSMTELAGLFEGVEKLRIAIQAGRIVISAHPQEGRVHQRAKRFVEKIQNGEPLDVASLFHGGGILDKAIHHGYARSGIKTRLAVAVEIEQKYLDCSMRNNPELWDAKSVAIEGPIQDVDLSRGAPEVDLLCAGIPCTGASRSGRSKNKLSHAESHSEAGALFFHTLEFVKVLNPACVWFENVGEYLSTASWEVIVSVLNSLQYDIQVRVLDSSEFGALERRKRMCCVATSRGLETGFDLDQVVGSKTREASLAEILEDIPEDSDRWKSFTYLAEKEKKDKAAGKGFARQLLTPNDDGCGTIGRGYSKCRSTEPFLVHPTDPEKSRIFSKIEHARVKTIPVDVIADETETTAHEILGQSVCFKTFEDVASSHGKALVQTFVGTSATHAVHRAA